MSSKSLAELSYLARRVFTAQFFQPVSQQLRSAVTLHQSSITNDNVTWPTQQHHSLLPGVLASVR